MKTILTLLVVVAFGSISTAQTLHNVCISEVASSGACGASATGIFVPATISISVGDSIEFETYMVALSGYNGTHNIRFNGGSPYDVNLPISTNVLQPKTTVRTPAFKVAGTYTMECTNSNHCQIAQLMQSWKCTGYSVTVVGPTGTDDIQSASNKIELAPNPANGFVKVLFPKQIAGKAEVTVYDIVGKRNLYGTYSAGSPAKINTSGLTPGMYIVKVLVSGKTYTKQLVVR